MGDYGGVAALSHVSHCSHSVVTALQSLCRMRRRAQTAASDSARASSAVRSTFSVSVVEARRVVGVSVK